jgi:hypothetical protein
MPVLSAGKGYTFSNSNDRRWNWNVLGLGGGSAGEGLLGTFEINYQPMCKWKSSFFEVFVSYSVKTGKEGY